MINNFKYKNLLIKSNSFQNFTNESIRTYTPQITEKDFKKGYVVRYFAQKANDPSSYIFEINKEEYSKLGSNPYYSLVSLDWKITGELDEIREANSKSVKFASKTLKAIEFHLPNKIQFHKK